jgi:N-acetylglucosaminyldiphosphoundecaprenol N-acetyl-beta-D-mannosaminyltransferase
VTDLRRERVIVDGIPVDPLTVAELHAYILETIRLSRRARVLNVNAHGLNLAADDAAYANTLRRAEIVFCDGTGVRLGAWILGKHLPQRITYADWMWELGQFTREQSLGMYFLGAAPNIAERAAARMRERIPGIRIVGAEHGYFSKERGSADSQEVVTRINASGAHILVTGFGMPVQERWIDEHWESLRVNIALSGGAVFDYLSGDLQRAPKVFRYLGMEWLGRLIIEPRRLFRRYVLGNPRFISRVVRSRLSEMIRKSRSL